MNFAGKGRRGGRPMTMLISATAAVVVSVMTVGQAQAQSSDWAFQQFEETRRQGLSFSDPGASRSTYRETRRTSRSTRSASPRANRNTRLASRGDTRRDFDDGNNSYTRSTRRSLSGGGVTWVASSGCLAGSLRSVIASVASNFGPVTVSSTCRSHGHNSRVGGAPRSHHLTGNAADFRVHGASSSAVYAFLRSSGGVGGIKHYGGGLFHIDTGDRRTW